jgi:hypothetical protein
VNPRHFGRRRAAPAAKNSGLTRSESAWAVFQHRAAVSVCEELRHLERDHVWLAKKIGMDSGWLQRKLRGHAPADLGEILEWGLILGVHVLPVVDEVGDLAL